MSTWYWRFQAGEASDAAAVSLQIIPSEGALEPELGMAAEWQCQQSQRWESVAFLPAQDTLLCYGFNFLLFPAILTQDCFSSFHDLLVNIFLRVDLWPSAFYYLIKGIIKILQLVSRLAFNPGSGLVFLANILLVHIHHYLQPTPETDDHLSTPCQMHYPYSQCHSHTKFTSFFLPWRQRPSNALHLNL